MLEVGNFQKFYFTKGYALKLAGAYSADFDLREMSLEKSGTSIQHYIAGVLFVQDYYPFGMTMSGRSYQGSEDYRYGFNGMEKDDKIKGDNNSYDFGARIYDPRVGRFLSLDPLMLKYPSSSPYQFAGNNPIYYMDKLGEEKITYLTVIDKNGDSKTVKLVNSEDNDYRMVKVTGNRLGLRIVSVETRITLDSRTGEVTTTEKLYDHRDFIEEGIKMIDGYINSLGEGGSQPNGLYLVSEDGGASPTKQIATEGDALTTDVGALMSALGAKGKSVKLPKFELEEALNAFKDVVDQSQSMGIDPLAVPDVTGTSNGDKDTTFFVNKQNENGSWSVSETTMTKNEALDLDSKQEDPDIMNNIPNSSK